MTFDRVAAEYRPMVRAIARRYYLPGGDLDDLVQEGLIGLWQAWQQHDPARGSFSTFANLCVEREIITAVKASTCAKHQPLSRAASLDAPAGRSDDSHLTLGEIVAGDPGPAARIDAQHELRVLLNRFHRMPALQQCVVIGRLDGDSYRTIATTLGCTEKTVDNALQRSNRQFSHALELAA